MVDTESQLIGGKRETVKGGGGGRVQEKLNGGQILRKTFSSVHQFQEGGGEKRETRRKQSGVVWMPIGRRNMVIARGERTHQEGEGI